MQDATLPPKPGMAHISTDVGASLLRGGPEPAPPAATRAPRVSCPAAPVHVDGAGDRARGPPPPSGRARAGPRSSGGEVPPSGAAHPFRDPRGRGRDASPRGPARRSSPGGAEPEQRTLAEVAQSIQKQHRAFAEALAARESHLGVVRAFWEKGDVRGCLSAVQRHGDPALAVDVFRFLRCRDRPQHFRLNMCAPTAAAVATCLRARVDAVTMVALSFLELVVRGFAQDIRTGCAFEERERAPVDIKGEERRQMCREARDAFVEVLPEVREIAKGQGGQPRALQERASSVAERIDRIAR